MPAHHCQDILRILSEYSLKPEFKLERQIARELFTISTGKVNDDDPFFEQRMSSFQEFFVFEYRLSEGFSGSTVFETFLYNGQSCYSLDEIVKFEQFRNFRHSLFQVESHKDDCLIVKDLIADRVDTVYPLPDYSFAGFDLKQIFDGRLINYESKNYFTKSFILHSKLVKHIIEKNIDEFLKGTIYCQAQKKIDWREELGRRNNLLSSVTNQKLEIQHAGRKKSIDLLNVTKKLADMPRTISSRNLIMSLGMKEDASPFVPETLFYDILPLLHGLAYCEIRSYRYKHIDPIKIYEMGTDKYLDIPGIPKVTKLDDESNIENLGIKPA
ncbi:hypothetical protein [Silvanigrella aquatica]|uniref:Uncharacterized protein n=1 Tax=Silvanigrella aquatica TaxID=1915309 RepID=A0A1L4D0Q6_9BACT|nr:hypothetical protein [Silvanigrella aquatica]APJ03793.1 hypothetical protein AXG55_07685 [Silvanigrella aquatica]